MFRAGLLILGVLSTADLLLPLLTDGQSPPMAVTLIAAVPAFFEPDVPAPAIGGAAAVIALTAVGTALVLKGRLAVAR